MMIRYGLIICCLLIGLPVHAVYYELEQHSNLIGEVGETKSYYHETLLDIARRHGFGYEEIKLANPDIDVWLPGDRQGIILPSQFILPNVEHKDIVVNVPEMRLYYFVKAQQGQPQKVYTYPLGVGREGWNIPYTKTNIVEKKKHPNWYPPESIRKEHAEQGDILPEIVEAGEDNPLGNYAMRLGIREYLIHGTNKPSGVGMRVSHGCIRLYPEDIEYLFQKISLKTAVNIINMPYKTGVKDDIIYIEFHPYFIEDKDIFYNNLSIVVENIHKLTGDRAYQVDWAKIYAEILKPTGMPVAIGYFLVTEEKLSKKQGVTMNLRLDETLK